MVLAFFPQNNIVSYNSIHLLRIYKKKKKQNTDFAIILKF